MEPQALSDFDEASRLVGDKHMDVMKGQAIVWPAVSFIAESGIILMVAFGAYWTLNGDLSPGTVIAFLVAWGFLFEPISKINPLSQTFTKGLVSAKRVFKIIDTPDETHLTEGKRPEKFTGKISFEDVTFSYNDEATALRNISLTALPGQTLALVGSHRIGEIHRPEPPLPLLRTHLRKNPVRRQPHLGNLQGMAARPHRFRHPRAISF